MFFNLPEKTGSTKPFKETPSAKKKGGIKNNFVIENPKLI